MTCPVFCRLVISKGKNRPQFLVVDGICRNILRHCLDFDLNFIFQIFRNHNRIRLCLCTSRSQRSTFQSQCSIFTKSLSSHFDISAVIRQFSAIHRYRHFVFNVFRIIQRRIAPHIIANLYCKCIIIIISCK